LYLSKRERSSLLIYYWGASPSILKCVFMGLPVDCERECVSNYDSVAVLVSSVLGFFSADCRLAVVITLRGDEFIETIDLVGE
jgi:hypothetical protein